MTVGWSENGSDDLWIGEMGLSARNGKTVDRRNEGGSEKNEIGVRNVFRKLTVSVDWIGAWIGVDRSDFRNSWSGSELVSFPVWSGSELGSWVDRSWVRVAASRHERIGASESLAASRRERIGASESSACVRACACERVPEINWSENNDWIQFQSFLAYFPVKLKMFSVWPNFTAQPNARFSGNWFPEINFSRNKRSLKCKRVT